MFIIETERLLLREFRIDDAEKLYLLNLDPDVIRYTGNAPFVSVEEAKMFIITYDHYRLFGLGRWALIRKEDNEFVGWCGLKYTPDLDEYDIGFRLFKSFWNKGYATEASIACIKYGFTKSGIKSIIGRAMRENIASIKVLEKSGLTYFKDFDFEGKDGVIYKITRT